MKRIFGSVAIALASGVLSALMISFLIGARSSNLYLDIGIGNAAALGLYGLEIEPMNKFGNLADLDMAEKSVSLTADLPTEGIGPPRCFENIGMTPVDIFVSSDDEADAGKEIIVEAIAADGSALNFTEILGAPSAGGTVFRQMGSVSLLRINRMYAETDEFVGNVFAGIDAVDADADGIPDVTADDIITAIAIGENQTQQGCYTVPAGFTALMQQHCFGNVANAALNRVTFRIRHSINGGPVRTLNPQTLANGSYECTPHDPPLVFPEKTDIEITAISTGNNALVDANFDILLFPNDMF